MVPWHAVDENTEVSDPRSNGTFPAKNERNMTAGRCLPDVAYVAPGGCFGLRMVRQEDDFMYGPRHGHRLIPAYQGARRASAGMPQSLTIGLLRLVFLARPLLLRRSNTE